MTLELPLVDFTYNPQVVRWKGASKHCHCMQGARQEAADGSGTHSPTARIGE